MSQGVLYDATKCIGCRACQVACKQWNGLPAVATVNTGGYENPPRMDAYTYTRIHFSEIEENGKLRWVFNKLQCMHCEHPACAEACIVGALEKRPDGAVMYDEGKCIGCRYCQVACPFGIPNFEWDKPMPWIRKCTFCADRQAAGLKPACVTTCPTGALKFGERGVLLAEARERIAAAPGKYVNHIYGEKEVGGTSWLYLSPVPFEQIGLSPLGSEPVTINAARAMGLVPPVLLGVAATMTGIYWLTKRRQRVDREEKKKDMAEVTK
ncbi:MAG: 4Fe-4S dicluster domain-containing protein [Chloroflexi bacterium]|nr:4Fe-4S dicluster domain-containing protein [Chloroflexota bacterium]